MFLKVSGGTGAPLTPEQQLDLVVAAWAGSGPSDRRAGLAYGTFGKVSSSLYRYTRSGGRGVIELVISGLYIYVRENVNGTQIQSTQVSISMPGNNWVFIMKDSEDGLFVTAGGVTAPVVITCILNVDDPLYNGDCSRFGVFVASSEMASKGYGISGNSTPTITTGLANLSLSHQTGGSFYHPTVGAMVPNARPYTYSTVHGSSRVVDGLLSIGQSTTLFEESTVDGITVMAVNVSGLAYLEN